MERARKKERGDGPRYLLQSELGRGRVALEKIGTASNRRKYTRVKCSVCNNYFFRRKGEGRMKYVTCSSPCALEHDRRSSRRRSLKRARPTGMCVRIPAGMRDDLEREARRRGVSVNSLVERAVRRAMKKEKKEKK